MQKRRSVRGWPSPRGRTQRDSPRVGAVQVKQVDDPLRKPLSLICRNFEDIDRYTEGCDHVSVKQPGGMDSKNKPAA